MTVEKTEIAASLDTIIIQLKALRDRTAALIQQLEAKQ